MDLIERAAKSASKDKKSSLLERAADRLKPQPAAEEPAGEVPAASPPADVPVDAGPARPARKSRYGEIDLDRMREMGFITPDISPTLTAEEFRIIKRTLLVNAFAKGDGAIHNGNLILVTSSQPGEGKTFCSINLALSIASEQDLTVLLIDADFAKPELLSVMGLEGGKGLLDVVSDPELDLADCMIRTNVPNLTIVPSGRHHNLTTELLASDRMGMMVEEIAKRYSDRVVIIDSPPALASSVASVLAMHVGQCLFVVQAERTTEPQVKEALALVSPCDNVKMILNRAKFSGGNKKFVSYYRYGYGNR